MIKYEHFISYEVPTAAHTVKTLFSPQYLKYFFLSLKSLFSVSQRLFAEVLQ